MPRSYNLESIRTRLPANKVDCLLYHSPCPDGVTSALSAHHFNPSITLIGINYGMPLPYSKLKDKCVVFADFAPDLKELTQLQKTTKEFVIIDHHEKAAINWQNQPQACIDQKECGATLLFKYFFPKKNIPRLLKLVKDRDCWLNQFSETKPFHYAYVELLTSIGYKNHDVDFSKLTPLLHDDKAVEVLIQRGTPLLEAMQLKIETCCKGAQKSVYRLKGKSYSLAMVAAGEDIDHSELGNTILKKFDVDVSLSYYPTYSEDTGKINGYKVSLRSDPKRCNVNFLANDFGGGGHPAAAGMHLKAHPHLYFMQRLSNALRFHRATKIEAQTKITAIYHTNRRKRQKV